jgi:hypothetical protein
MNTTQIAKINNVEIAIVEKNGEKYIPIKPICQALGIDDKSQRDKLKNDPAFNSVGVITPSTGTDGKQYEMYCLPQSFLFGWLFSINPDKVKPEARDAVFAYKMKCIEVLNLYFSDTEKFVTGRDPETQSV